ncbi:alpha/beta fold hydrolase [Mucilaginibacter sp. X4EP1]|uniref:alpha/beta fold hydrolase n=1 Tax=Mucilaginibacter sp. X4EP1 TaxID=2723092 RepID=UPI002168330B|nr:alpha/beta hydrolase [Mucilaginibacter sp. X4EP1]MCS3811554.1 pimeloyl-ACP methyl ester carboxylesterase [Mucilaginibacter sp. X4EP1]
MKKIKILLIALLFALLCINVFGQGTSPAFKVKVSGHGKQHLLFIPGFACSGEVWNETLPLFEKDFTCYTLTMPGFAGIPAQSDPSFKGWESAIAAYLTDNKLSKTIVIGHSMGGGLALALAADHPDLVSKIVVVDALPCLAAIMNPAFQAKENFDCSPIVNQFTKMDSSQFKQMQTKGMQRLVADTSKINLLVNWSLKSDRATFAKMYCDFSNTDLRQKIGTIQCPALILLEANFTRLKPAIEEQYKELKTAQLVYAAKGLHFIMYDDRDWFDQQLTAFIK